MIKIGKHVDERHEAGGVECWFLHGAVGLAADWRGIGRAMAGLGMATRAVDLWRFLDCCAMPMDAFGRALNAEVAGEVSRSAGRVLVGYSMGGRLALHALLEEDSPWDAAVVISAHPGLADEGARASRRAMDAEWASRAISGGWDAFLESWHGQRVLAGAAMPDGRSRAARLGQRRREIARSFVDWSLGAQVSLWDRLGEIEVPLLWLTGEDDAKFTRLAKDACGRLPRASHVVIPNAGHRVPWQNEVAFCEVVANFTQRACDER